MTYPSEASELLDSLVRRNRAPVGAPGTAAEDAQASTRCPVATYTHPSTTASPDMTLELPTWAHDAQPPHAGSA